MTVRTPVATAQVRGTIFSVRYEPRAKIADVDVLTGLVAVVAQRFADMEFKVQDGRRLRLAATGSLPVFDLLTAAAVQELKQVEAMKIAPSITDRWDQTILYVSALPLYKKALIEITKYEMKVLVRALKYFAPLRWNHQVPAALTDVTLEEGDYKDPWEYRLLL